MANRSSRRHGTGRYSEECLALDQACKAGMDDPSKGPTAAQLIAAAMTVDGYQEFELPRSWLRFAGEHPDVAGRLRVQSDYFFAEGIDDPAAIPEILACFEMFDRPADWPSDANQPAGSPENNQDTPGDDVNMTDYTDSSESSASSDDENGSGASETETGGAASGTSTDGESDTTLVDSGYGNSSYVEESGDGDGEATSESEAGSSNSEPGPSDSDEHHIAGFANQILDIVASEHDLDHAPTMSMDEYISQFGYGKLEDWEPGSWESFWVRAEVSLIRMPYIYRRHFENFEEETIDLMARKLELEWIMNAYAYGEESRQQAE
ncbi:uncharacterized protein Triagg1_1386 [Trichoderma aggressivum f. europaeum]|uniref:Uncharacterized protein n=1 Tax=Trichoderma aggressivum f. europaeum TaxID=173218 RepID=A0AAE1M2Q6_9HYPO|nr:hypothetical protein Triagg1_1386 [Trichoderma aggressivum f. europaeum]